MLPLLLRRSAAAAAAAAAARSLLAGGECRQTNACILHHPNTPKNTLLPFAVGAICSHRQRHATQPTPKRNLTATTNSCEMRTKGQTLGHLAERPSGRTSGEKHQWVQSHRPVAATPLFRCSMASAAAVLSPSHLLV